MRPDNPDLKRRTARRRIPPKHSRRALLGAVGLLLGSLACSNRSVETLKVEVLSVRPHDPAAYTQGLLLHEGMLYESTGRYGESSLRRVDPQNGKVLQQVKLPDGYFGEGLARQESRLVQLTWWEDLAFIWTIEGFRPAGQFSYKGEAWGLCYDGEHFLMSDGSDTLTVRGPATFDVVDRIRVTLHGTPLTRLNELECVGDSVYANVYFTDRIVRIDKTTGSVTAVVDASGLLTPAERLRADVLNGIAHDPEKDSFLITGKLWPRLFEVRFVPQG